MIGRVSMVAVVTLCSALAFYRFGLGRQSLPVDVVFVGLALAAVVLGVRSWAGLLTEMRSAGGWTHGDPGSREGRRI